MEEPKIAPVRHKLESTLLRPKQPPPLPPPRKSSKNRIIPLNINLPQSALDQHNKLLTKDETDSYNTGIPADIYFMNILQQQKTDTQDLNKKLKTFDQDPTNLVTCYTESLEQCNFDIDDQTVMDVATIRSQMASNSNYQKQELGRQSGSFRGASTPNLNHFIAQKTDSLEFDHHKSLKEINVTEAHPDTEEEEKHGILNVSSTGSQGSKVALSKGVSFCPIVSEISWQEEIPVSDDTGSVSGVSTSSSDEYHPNGHNVIEDDRYYDYDENLEDIEEINEIQTINDGSSSVVQYGDFSEYLLPPKTHTFKTELTMMIDEKQPKCESATMHMPIKADVHTNTSSSIMGMYENFICL